LWSSTVQANPVGEQVVAGAAGFERVGGALTITQGTDRAVINWNSFSIGAGEITKFVQPNSSSAVLNRVITANNPSAIYGALQANGQVYLINPAGVFIGPSGLVDTAGFVASTHDVGDKEFMAGGDLNFTGNSGASIVNQGRIEAKQGDVFLVARQVSNEGQIMASDGTVGMVSGTEVCLHSIGPNNYKVRLIDVANDAGVKKTDNGIADVVNAGVIEAANAELESTGNYLSLAIKNTGVIRATGVIANADGTVTLTGGEGDILNTGVVAAIQKNIQGESVGGKILASAKNITTDPGSIMTASGSEKGGEIKVSASDTIYVGGKMEAKSDEGKGGKIQLTGERVGLFKAEVDASGKTAGGTVLVGGDYLGKNPEVPNAKAVVMTSDSVIRANATVNGDGGKVILWSDEYTGFYGEIFARAGLSGGDGGFVETSSYDNLQAWGSVDTFSFFGKSGLWLLDPTELYITTTSSNMDVTGTGTDPDPFRYQPPAGSLGAQSQANANTILQALDAGQNVTIQVNTATGSANTVGNIYVARPLEVNKTEGTLGLTQGNLTLLAGGASIDYTAGVPDQGLGVVGGSGAGSIFVDEAIYIGGSLTMIAGNDPGRSVTTAGVTTVTGGTGGSITVSAPITSLNGAITLQAGWGLAANGGATGGQVTVNEAVSTKGLNGRVVITGGSANSSDSTAGDVTVNATITLGTNLALDPIYGYAGSVIAAGSSTGGTGGNLEINAPINGLDATLTLQSGIGLGGSPGTFAISAGAPIGQQNSLATRLASVAIKSQTTVDLQSDIFAKKIVLAPTPIPTATGPSNTGSIWFNESPIPGLNSYSFDNAAISRLFANLEFDDAIEIGDTTFNGDVAIGQAGGVVFSASNLKFIGSPAAPGLDRAISFNATSGTCLTLTSPFSTGKITFDTGGRVFTRFGTADVDIKFTGGTVDFTRVTGLGQSASDPLRLDVGTIQGAVTGDAFLNNSTSLNFGLFNITGSLNVVTGGAITQSGAITATGAANVLNASGSDVTLANAGNNFGTVTFTSVQNAAITDQNAIVFGASTLTGGLTVNAGGNVTQTGALVVPGTSSITSTGAITLNNAANDFTGAVGLSTTGNNAISIRDQNAMDLGNLSTAAGTAAVTIVTGGNLSQQSGTSITSLGTGDFTLQATASGTSINLATDSNGNPILNNIASANVVMTGGANFQDFSLRNTAVSADTPSATTALSLRNLTLIFDSAAISLPATNFNTLTGNLELTAGGAITQSGALTVGGTSTITSTGGAITLSNAGNDYTGAVTLSTAGNNAISIRDQNAMVLGNLSTAAGTAAVTIVTGGNLTQQSGTSITSLGTGNFTLQATAAGTSVNLGTYTDGSGSQIPNNIASANVVMTGGANFQDFSLRNTAVTADTPSATTALSLRNLTLIFDSAAISLPATNFNTLSGNLVLTAGGAITQLGALTVGGTSTITSTAGAITLSDAGNDYTGAVGLSTTGNNAISIRDQNAMILGNVSMGSAGSGNLTVVGGGALTQAVDTSISSGTGSVTINAGANTITLANQNDFRGVVSMTGGITQITDLSSLTLGTLATGALTAISTGALNLGQGDVIGALSATSNGGAISQTGGLTLGSTSIFNSGSGSVTMTAGLGGAAQNSFGGAVSMTVGNADFYMASGATGVDRLAQTAGSTVVTGTFTLRSPLNTDFNLAKGVGAFKLTTTQLANMNVGTLAATASGTGNVVVGTFNPAGVTGLNLITAGTGNITADSITVGSLSLTSGGTVAFTQPNQVRNLGTSVIGSGGLTFQNQTGLNLTGAASMPGRLSLEVAGQFNNQTGAESPLAGVQLGSVIKSLSLMGGLPNSVSGLSGFSYRYDGVIPTSGNVMSYAVSPLTQFAPSGTTIAGVDLSGTQTGGGQFNTFLTGSDDLNWIISDFGKFNLPKVSSAGLEYTIYPKRVEPETRTLPDSTLSQLRRELGRPPTIEEINKREVSMRQSDRLRSGSILERSSLDGGEESDEPQENAKTTVPLPTEGQVPQANQVPKKATAPDNGSPEALPPVASWGRLPSGSVQRDEKGAETVRELLMKERASAEVDLSIPVANTQ
jgi:filamentous hemagglutinin family protein